MRALLKVPAVAPSCFGAPERCAECRGCGLRLRCYQRQVDRDEVFLLPVDRPVQHRATWGTPFVREYTPKEPK